MIWTFDDGTRFSLGGNVEGDSALALKLHTQVANARVGYGPSVFEQLPPNGLVKCDMNNERHVDSWLRDQAAKYGVKVVSAPDLPAAAPQEDYNPDTVY